MFGLGFGEILIIFVLALIFIGPKRLPEAGRKMGEWYRQMRDVAESVRGVVSKEFQEPIARSPESRVPAPDLEVPSPESEVPSPESRVPSPEFEDPESSVQIPESKNGSYEMRVMRGAKREVSREECDGTE